MTLYTEKEAAEKWCPMFRVGAWNGAELFTNRDRASDDHRDVHSRCIGSRCMAWRWGTAVATNRDHEGEFFFNPAPRPGDKDNQCRGYCGAFGKVEP